MSQDLYQEVILEEYARPQNIGEMESADVSLSEANSSCGDMVTVFLKFNQGKISQVSWKGVGCAISIASASLLSEHIKGLTAQEVMNLKKSDIESLLGIEEISFGREKCLLLALNAFQKAITAYQLKGQ